LQDSIELGKVDVVGIADFRAVPLISGAAYLWEGLRVKSFRITAKRIEVDSVKANLRTRSPNIEVSRDDSGRVEVNGSDLFSAYLVVQMNLGERSVVGTLHLAGTGQFAGRVGDEYRVQFSLTDSSELRNASAFQEHPDSNALCAWKLVVTLEGRLGPDGKPFQEQWPLCERSQPRSTYLLDARPNPVGLVIDQLAMENFAWVEEPREPVRARRG